MKQVVLHHLAEMMEQDEKIRSFFFICGERSIDESRLKISMDKDICEDVQYFQSLGSLSFRYCAVIMLLLASEDLKKFPRIDSFSFIHTPLHVCKHTNFLGSQFTIIEKKVINRTRE